MERSPSPCPLPLERVFTGHTFSHSSTRPTNPASGISTKAATVSPLPGERAGVRASNHSNFTLLAQAPSSPGPLSVRRGNARRNSRHRPDGGRYRNCRRRRCHRSRTRRTRRISWRAWANRNAGSGNLPNWTNGRGFRCRVRIRHNEIRKSAWAQGKPGGAIFQDAGRSILDAGWMEPVTRRFFRSPI